MSWLFRLFIGITPILNYIRLLILALKIQLAKTVQVCILLGRNFPYLLSLGSGADWERRHMYVYALRKTLHPVRSSSYSSSLFFSMLITSANPEREK